MEGRRRGSALWGLVILFIFLSLFVSERGRFSRTSDYTFAAFKEDLEKKKDQISSVVIAPNKEIPTGEVSVYWKEDNNISTFYIADTGAVIEWMESTGFTDYRVTDIVNREGWFYKNGAILILGGVFLWFMFSFMSGQQGAMGAGNNKMMDFGKSRATMVKESNETTFDDVAGLEEEKEDLEEVVDFLRDPEKYTR